MPTDKLSRWIVNVCALVTVTISQMKAALKLAARRLLLRWLRKLVDLVDDRLHAAEVKLRAVPEETAPLPLPQLEKASMANPFPVAAPRVKRTRRHVTAADFDRRFA